ncbi:uncharacterized protein AMSG_04588 [Thecamonas trahens ATCC 50062]|uniref:Domain X domain-containing protein n=1 Tax=Thecamonas trahens ATCC 50062 TaxID=461836 RepID=A0A0L0DC08_THETB|nr:hypothetical protein AMSG_04588 [Thecamonas trahens ATCC 50062]KNC48843.1 hypothetical protein AMSG_04588 [Thecamonas trahens ATCC 50062]|eukprot:XP_013758263.1 hypothetical protein AMSG_04588 [Thecamonas trahens ATCC 50062]
MLRAVRAVLASGSGRELSGVSGDVLAALVAHGFCDEGGNGVAKVGWTNASDYVIVGSYNGALAGARTAAAAASGGRVASRCVARPLAKRMEFIMRTSCVKTLAHKHRAGGRQHVYARFGADLVAWMEAKALRRVALDLGPDLVEHRVVAFNRRLGSR